MNQWNHHTSLSHMKAFLKCCWIIVVWLWNELPSWIISPYILFLLNPLSHSDWQALQFEMDIRKQTSPHHWCYNRQAAIMFTLGTVEVARTTTHWWKLKRWQPENEDGSNTSAISPKTKAAYSFEVQEPIVRSIALIDEQLLQCPQSSRLMRRGHGMGSRWRTYAHKHYFWEDRLISHYFRQRQKWKGCGWANTTQH